MTPMRIPCAACASHEQHCDSTWVQNHRLAWFKNVPEHNVARAGKEIDSDAQGYNPAAISRIACVYNAPTCGGD